MNHYDFADATFLAERLFAEVVSDESLHLLATAYYRSGKLNEAYDVLKKHGARTAKNEFLMGKCCADLEKYSEAESCLSKVEDVEDAASFSRRLLGSIYSRTERRDKALEAERDALRSVLFLSL